MMARYTKFDSDPTEHRDTDRFPQRQARDDGKCDWTGQAG